MANELLIGAATGNTVYAQVQPPPPLAGRWNGAAFETYSSSHYPLYPVATTEQGDSGTYVGDLPAGITGSGPYDIYYYLQQGGSPAEGDPICGHSQWPKS